MDLVKNHLHWSDRKIGNPTGFSIRGQKPLLVQVQLTTPSNKIDESSNGRTGAKPHGEPGFESQLVDQFYIMRKKINNMTPGALKISC